MKTAGQWVGRARQERGLSLAQAAKETKIREHFLKALEEDEYSQLPSAPAARGFLKNYAEYLGLPADSVLALFRRDYHPEKGLLVPAAWREGQNQAQTSWVERWQRCLVAGVVLLLGLYLGRQYLLLARGPYLIIQSPPEGKEVGLDKIEVVGRADVDALVTINDQQVILNSNGEFRYSLALFAGENQIVVKAKGRNGQETLRQRTVFRLDK